VIIGIGRHDKAEARNSAESRRGEQACGVADLEFRPIKLELVCLKEFSPE